MGYISPQAAGWSARARTPRSLPREGPGEPAGFPGPRDAGGQTLPGLAPKQNKNTPQTLQGEAAAAGALGAPDPGPPHRPLPRARGSTWTPRWAPQAGRCQQRPSVALPVLLRGCQAAPSAWRPEALPEGQTHTRGSARLSHGPPSADPPARKSRPGRDKTSLVLGKAFLGRWAVPAHRRRFTRDTLGAFVRGGESHKAPSAGSGR